MRRSTSRGIANSRNSPNFNPRYKADNFRANQERFAPLLDVSHELNISPAQLALSWLLHQGKDIFPIPGSRKIDRINENAKAIDIALYPEVLDRINKIAEIGITKGNTLL